MQAKNHLPHYLTPRLYRVSETWRLKPEVAIICRSLRPINIIVLEDLEEFTYGAIHETVSAGLDFMHCPLVLKVEDDLSFMSHGTAGAHECALRRKLVLMPTSFLARDLWKFVEKQLKRLHKYYLRDFEWGFLVPQPFHVPSTVLCNPS